VERGPKPIMDQVHISSSESTARVPSPVVQPSPVSKSNEIPKQNPHHPSIPYPSSLADALALMPKYAKMLKDLLTNKEKLLEFANTPLNENCSTLMLPEVIPTRMTLELANRSFAYPAGIVEDIFVQVGKFTFPADFIVIDYNIDPRIPLILGIPFLRTARALVDVHEEKLTLRIKRKLLVFRAEKALRYPSEDHHFVHSIDIVDSSSDNDSI
nr:hypothetical protein [Tanacetum cinerariifolium]